MLLASRLDVAQGIERAEPVDLLALAAEEAAHFDLEVSGDAVTINADPMLLRRLVRNLLENARVHAGGATDLRIERAERHANIVIEDAGPGVPPRIARRFSNRSIVHRPPRSRAARASAFQSSDRSHARTAARWSTRRARKGAAALR